MQLKENEKIKSCPIGKSSELLASIDPKEKERGLAILVSPEFKEEAWRKQHSTVIDKNGKKIDGDVVWRKESAIKKHTEKMISIFKMAKKLFSGAEDECYSNICDDTIKELIKKEVIDICEDPFVVFSKQEKEPKKIENQIKVSKSDEPIYIDLDREIGNYVLGNDEIFREQQVKEFENLIGLMEEKTKNGKRKRKN